MAATADLPVPISPATNRPPASLAGSALAPTSHAFAVPARPLAPQPRPLASIFLPKEHGSWSLALEPLALGLLVAPSWAGGALAAAALAGFFARRPLKAAFAPANSQRRIEARETVVMWGALAGAGIFEVLVLAPWTALWPLLPAAVLGVVFAWFDAQGESRAAAAEVAGSAAFACVPAAIATLAGTPPGTALALAGLALARSIPTVLVVRTCLRLAKGALASRALPLLVSACALVVAALLVAFDFAASPAFALVALLFVRACWLLGPWAPAWPARRIGMMEGVVGLLYVALLAATWPAAVLSNP